MSGTRRSVRLFGENLEEGMHICTFFRTSAEKYRVLMPFIREGMEQGDRAFHIVNPSLRGEHAQRIAEAGIDAARAKGEGQLEIMGWDEAYLRGGSFDHSAMLSVARTAKGWKNSRLSHNTLHCGHGVGAERPGRSGSPARIRVPCESRPA